MASAPIVPAGVDHSSPPVQVETGSIPAIQPVPGSAVRSPFVILAILALLTGSPPALSQTARLDPSEYDRVRATKIVPAVRISEEIALDGRLNEAAWELAEPAGDFIQILPNTGASIGERTEVRFLYDENNLCVGYYCWDSAMENMVVNDLREDFGFLENDSIGLIIDTLHDRRSAFNFVTNAAGARNDAQFFNDGQTINRDWDGVWEVRVARSEEGWTAEFVIPFRTLRFSNSSSQEWGLNMTRRMPRRNEESAWTPIPIRYRATRVSVAETLTGLENIPSVASTPARPWTTTKAGAAGKGRTERSRRAPSSSTWECSSRTTPRSTSASTRPSTV